MTEDQRKFFRTVVEAITYKGHNCATFERSTHSYVEVTIRVPVKERTDGQIVYLKESLVVPSYRAANMKENNILRAVRDVIIKLEMHEVDEQFMWEGRRIFDPHIATPEMDAVLTKKVVGPLEDAVEKLKKAVFSDDNRES